MKDLLSNLNQLVHIETVDKFITKRYTYRPAEKGFWIFADAKPEKFTATFYYDRTEEQLGEEGYIVDKDKVVWKKPQCFLWFSNSDKPLEYTFDTYEQVENFVSKIRSKCDPSKVNLIQLNKL